MDGRNPITASHCPEYIAKLSATSQGPPAVSVWRKRVAHGVGACGCTRVASGGTTRQTQTAMMRDSTASNHHQACQLKVAMNSGPHNSEAAAPNGM